MPCWLTLSGSEWFLWSALSPLKMQRKKEIFTQRDKCRTWARSFVVLSLSPVVQICSKLELQGTSPTRVWKCFTFLGCCNKVLQLGWHWTTGIYSLRVLGAKISKSRCWRGKFFFTYSSFWWPQAFTGLSNINASYAKMALSPSVSFLCSFKDQSHWRKGPPYSRMISS